jgi:pyrroloquinoline-quinone synthase
MNVLEEIDAMIDRRHLLGHSFYRQWVAGTLPTEALKEYAKQYFAFESSFPRFLSSLHARSDNAAVRQALLDNLWDEEHGEENHAELWLRFAEGVGMRRADVAGAARNDATRALVRSYEAASTKAPVAAGIAAIHAYERQVPAVAAAKIAGLETHFGIRDERTLKFWEVHRSLDEEHAAGERAALAGAPEQDRVAMLDATGQALDAWWQFLDAVDVPA